MPQSTNFFAALDDSDDDSAVVRPTAKHNPVSINTNTNRNNNAGSNSGISSSKRNDRRKNNDRNNTKGGRGEGGRVRPAARDGKRTFDRRSGTGRGREIKKDGGGARNWGSDKADARKAEGIVVDENEVGKEVSVVDVEEDGSAAAASGGQEGDDGLNEEEEAVVEPEPEVVTRTLDEYYEDRRNELKDKPQFQPTIKKEVRNEFAGVTARTVVKDEGFVKMGDGKAIRVKSGGGGKKDKQLLDVAFRTGSRPGGGDSRYGDRGDRGDRGGRGNDRRREDGGRGRGRGRGRGNRRSGRGGRDGGRGPSVVDPLDPSSFPSL